jgi:hypothetical protein
MIIGIERKNKGRHYLGMGFSSLTDELWIPPALVWVDEHHFYQVVES